MDMKEQTKCHEKLNLHFDQISYKVKGKKAHAHILHDLNGQFNNGRLTAIMGASGAGKTSLLNVLTGFKTKGVTGIVKVNGVERNPDEFRTKSCYIVQNQPMLLNLTCRETMLVAANLKLKPGWKEDITTGSGVSNILHMLSLTNVEETIVGSLSGGEKKRLSIGLELITNPPIMFCDEPTSGLDSVAAAQVITHLQTLSALGHAIICVIHQPSSHIFNMFDDLYLLSDGQCLYSGPTADMVRVFQQAGFTCPEYYNRADFVPMLTITTQVSNGHQAATNKDKKTTFIRYPTSQYQQFLVLFRRSFIFSKRDMLTILTMFLTYIAVAILYGIVYYKIGDDAAKVDSNFFCLYACIIFLHFSNSVTTVLLFPQESSVFLHEHLNNWYSLPSYYFAKLLSTYPFQLVHQVSFVSITYFMSGQPLSVNRFFMTYLAFQILAKLAQALGLVLGAVFDVQLGLFLVVASALPMYLFSGFLVRLKDIPYVMQWIPVISYVRHTFEAVITALYGFNRPKLACAQLYCHFKNPQMILENISFSDENYWWNIIALVIWIVFLYVCLYVALKWKVYKSKL